MGTARFCDRCKTTLAETDKTFNISVQIFSSSSTSPRVKVEDASFSDFEICEGCSEKVKAVIFKDIKKIRKPRGRRKKAETTEAAATAATTTASEPSTNEGTVVSTSKNAGKKKAVETVASSS